MNIIELSLPLFTGIHGRVKICREQGSNAGNVGEAQPPPPDFIDAGCI